MNVYRIRREGHPSSTFVIADSEQTALSLLTGWLAENGHGTSARFQIQKVSAKGTQVLLQA